MGVANKEWAGRKIGAHCGAAATAARHGAAACTTAVQRMAQTALFVANWLVLAASGRGARPKSCCWAARRCRRGAQRPHTGACARPPALMVWSSSQVTSVGAAPLPDGRQQRLHRQGARAACVGRSCSLSLAAPAPAAACRRRRRRPQVAIAIAAIAAMDPTVMPTFQPAQRRVLSHEEGRK